MSHTREAIISYAVLPTARPFSQGDVANFIESEIRRVCEPNHWTIGALTMQEDHVHRFVSAPPAVSPSQSAHTLKAITARQVFKHYPTVKKQLWDGSFWSRSFYVGAAGDVTEAKNILHRGNQLLARNEPTSAMA